MMRAAILCLLVGLVMAADDYDVEREVVLRLVDGRELQGVYTPETGVLILRGGGGAARVMIPARDVASSELSAAALDIVAKRKAAERAAQHEREVEVLAERQRALAEANAKLQNETAERERKAQLQQAAREVATMYVGKGYVFNPLAMSAEEMHAAYTAGEEAKRERETAAAREQVQRQRATEEAERQRKADAEEARMRALRVAAATQREQRERAKDEQRRLIEQADRQARVEGEAQRARERALTAMGLFIAGACVVVLPIIVAFARRHPHRIPIAIVCLGMLIVGGYAETTYKSTVTITLGIYGFFWVGCLAWASWPLRRRHGTPIQPAPIEPAQDARAE